MVKIREFQLDDKQALQDCLLQCLADHSENSSWSLDDLCQAATKLHYQLRVVEQRVEQINKLVAYCLFNMVSDECNLLYIAVVPAMQQRGLGRQLIEDLLIQCRQKNIQSVFLEVRESNQAANALYLAMGFSEFGRRPDYYPALNVKAERSAIEKKGVVTQAASSREAARLYCFSINKNLA